MWATRRTKAKNEFDFQTKQIKISSFFSCFDGRKPMKRPQRRQASFIFRPDLSGRSLYFVNDTAPKSALLDHFTRRLVSNWRPRPSSTRLVWCWLGHIKNGSKNMATDSWSNPAAALAACRQSVSFSSLSLSRFPLSRAIRLVSWACSLIPAGTIDNK